MRILAVEDDPAILRMLERGLAAGGHEVLTATNGIDGAILAGDGLIAHRLVLGINVNLWWGLVLILFGAAMLALAARARHAPPVSPPSGADDRPRRVH